VNLDSVDLFRYRLPLHPPPVFDGGSAPVREGVLLRLTTKRGAVGWGEAAPLPGFSDESLPAAVDQLKRVRGTIRQRTLPDLGTNGHDPWKALEIDADLVPSVRFALETAILMVAADAVDEPPPRVLADDPRPAVSLNALLDGDPDEVEEAAEVVRDRGYRSVKLKVGRDDPDHEATAVTILSDILGPGVTLRLDANRGWRFEEAVAFADEIRSVPIEYIEEPIADPSRLREFERQSGLPVALDETTREVRPQQLRSLRFARAVILKPTLLGGMRRTVQWARAAQKLHMTPVLSSSFESGVGTRAIIALAAVLGTRDVPAGLDPYERFDEDVLDPRLDLRGPTVDVRDLFATDRTVDLDRLDPISPSA
jgi:O-succinylbenzoate synthase